MSHINLASDFKNRNIKYIADNCEVYLSGADGMAGSLVRLCSASGKVTFVSGDPLMDLMSVLISKSYQQVNYFIDVLCTIVHGVLLSVDLHF